MENDIFDEGTTTNKMMKWWPDPGHSVKHRKLLINGIKSCVFPPGNKIITFVFEFLQSLCPVGKPITIDLRQSRMMNVIPSTPTIITVNWRWNCIYSFTTKGLKTGQGMKKKKQKNHHHWIDEWNGKSATAVVPTFG